MGICGVAVSLIFLCGVAVNKIPSRGVTVISNRTVCSVFDFKPAMFGEKKFLADPLRCCGLLFDKFDRLSPCRVTVKTCLYSSNRRLSPFFGNKGGIKSVSSSECQAVFVFIYK